MIYFDNAATTKVYDNVAKVAYDTMTQTYGNPSSVHDFGFCAEKILKESRSVLLSTIGSTSRNDDFFFTSSGTEANNLAILGAVASKKHLGKKVFFSDSEHASVFALSKHLSESGYDVKYIPTKNGVLDLDFCKKEFDKNTILISCMNVNNETGAIYDINSLSKIKESLSPEAILHTDAVQAFGKIQNLAKLGADLISVSGHKVHAPKGIGGLYLKEKIKIKPILFGGGQEKNIRPGTEALPNIAAFAHACKQISVAENKIYVKALLDYLYQKAKIENLEIKFNIPQNHLPYVVSLTLPNIKSEVMLRHLSSDGIYVSAGSACSSKHKENRVLSAFGLDNKSADCTIRVSFSELNTKEEIDKFIKSLSFGINNLIRIK